MLLKCYLRDRHHMVNKAILFKCYLRVRHHIFNIGMSFKCYLRYLQIWQNKF